MLSLVSQRSALHFAEGYRDPETALAASWGPPSHALHLLVLGSGTERQHPSAQPLRVHSPGWENLRLPLSLQRQNRKAASSSGLRDIERWVASGGLEVHCTAASVERSSLCPASARGWGSPRWAEGLAGIFVPLLPNASLAP